MQPSIDKRQHIYSVSDWDFQTANWMLSNTQYHSPPTSIITTVPVLPNVILCRVADTLVLPVGRMVWWSYNQGEYAAWVTFRNQAPLGSASRQNCYRLYAISTATIWLYSVEDGVEYWGDTWTAIWEKNKWEHWRLTWWNGVNEQNTPALCVELEHEIAGEWVSAGILYHTANLWKDSAINRCGILIEQYMFYHDDTEIWIPL